jgi:DNA repair protein SbcC/Rad50
VIPRKITLRGFLCYKDEQTVAFDGAHLWMLAGVNGSGKSTIFDAITFCLFGAHRGGSSGHSELINKESNAMAVEFDFSVDDAVYQIRRGLKRDAKGKATSTQGVYRYDAPQRKFVPVNDAASAEGFKKWVRENVGLDFDTFTSSVLLLQGKAEKLLDSKPAGRAEVLAGIVDLERYQRLHEKADEIRKKAKADHDSLTAQLSGIPIVSEFDMLAAENKVVDAEAEKSRANDDIERRQQAEFDARNWHDAAKKLRDLKAKQAQSQQLIADADTIVANFTRFTELRGVIPNVLLIQEKNNEIAQSEREVIRHGTAKVQHAAKKLERQDAVETGKKKRSQLQKTLTADEAALQKVVDQLRDLGGPLAQLAMYEQQNARRDQLRGQLDKLPKISQADVDKAQATVDDLITGSQTLPLLDRFAQSRGKLGELQKRLDHVRSQEADLKARGLEAKKRHDEKLVLLEDAKKARQSADEAAAAAGALSQQARTLFDELKKVEGAKVCRACGSPLTAGHLDEEKKKRDRELKAAGKKHKESVEAQTLAVRAEESAREAEQKLLQDLEKLRTKYSEVKGELQLTASDRERLVEEVKRDYLAVPERVRLQIANGIPDDWTATVFPEAAELTALRKKVAQLDVAQAELKGLRDQFGKVQQFATELKAIEQTHEQLRKAIAGDPAKLRTQEASAKAEEATYREKVVAARKQLKDLEGELERSVAALTAEDKLVASAEAEIRAEQAKQEQLRDAVVRATDLLPAEWREQCRTAGLAEQYRWKSELDELTAKKVEDRHRELATTRHTVDAMKGEIAEAEAAEARYPADVRMPLDEARKRLDEAKRLASVADESLSLAREAKAVLDRHVADRASFGERIRECEAELKSSKMIAELLGRDRLQRHLVRLAERQIIEFANSILDRLSRGDLFLRLRAGDEGAPSERALELEAYNRKTSDEAINVAFLSGSQKFRVAVSLALAIGQYASKQHRPIESVIIDEGFGCLDQQGRQVMIQELQNLSGHLKFIMLVSHQEDFAEAFPNGYRFELVNGATKVSRLRPTI